VGELKHSPKHPSQNEGGLLLRGRRKRKRGEGRGREMRVDKGREGKKEREKRAMEKANGRMWACRDAGLQFRVSRVGV